MSLERTAALVVTVALAAGCTSASDRAPSGSVGSAGSAAPDAGAEATRTAACVRAHRSSIGLPELRGAAPDGDRLWALLFGDYPARRGREIKIVWRFTSLGPLTLFATGPRGHGRISPLWGPEEHTGSNWDRPGSEWGSGWRFPRPGCWTVHLLSGSDHGMAGIRVTR